MYPLMIFMFCFFIGSVAMFLYSLRKKDETVRSLSDEHAQLRVLLRAMESRLDNIEKMLSFQNMSRDGMATARSADAGHATREEDAQDSESAGHDPLLHLSFEDPDKSGKDMDLNLDLYLDPDNPDSRHRSN